MKKKILKFVLELLGTILGSLMIGSVFAIFIWQIITMPRLI